MLEADTTFRHQALAAPADDVRTASVKASGLLISARASEIATFVDRLSEQFEKPAFFSILDGVNQYIRYGSREFFGTMPLAHGLCQYLVFGDDDILVIDDTLADARYSSRPVVKSRHQPRFYAGAVIRSGSGFRLGALCIVGRAAGSFSSGQTEELRNAADRLESLVENYRQQQVAESEVLDEVCGSLPLLSVPIALEPIVSTTTMSPVGHEALLRWRRRNGEQVRPDRLIPALERTGLIFAMDRAVMRAACRRAASMPPDQSVAVNVSASWFRHDAGALVQAVQQALKQSALLPARLTIEVTEQVMILDAASAALAFDSLKALGVMLALDDFGKGYSSLDHLASYPFDIVKIDKTFTRKIGCDLRSDQIMSAMIQLIGALGKIVCVEGVETPGQLAFLREQKLCDRVQGYLISDLQRRP